MTDKLQRLKDEAAERRRELSRVPELTSEDSWPLRRAYLEAEAALDQTFAIAEKFADDAMFNSSAKIALEAERDQARALADRLAAGECTCGDEYGCLGQRSCPRTQALAAYEARDWK